LNPALHASVSCRCTASLRQSWSCTRSTNRCSLAARVDGNRNHGIVGSGHDRPIPTHVHARRALANRVALFARSPTCASRQQWSPTFTESQSPFVCVGKFGPAQWCVKSVVFDSRFVLAPCATHVQVSADAGSTISSRASHSAMHASPSSSTAGLESSALAASTVSASPELGFFDAMYASTPALKPSRQACFAVACRAWFGGTWIGHQQRWTYVVLRAPRITRRCDERVVVVGKGRIRAIHAKVRAAHSGA
jgi:hypothetical protein